MIVRKGSCECMHLVPYAGKDLVSACIWFQMVIVRRGSCECMHLVPDGDSQERIL